MYNLMKKIPGGLLLIPMLLAALTNTLVQTFYPELFTNLGGLSEALFTPKGLNYVVGATVFFSATGIDVRVLPLILKKEGSLIVVKTILCIALGFLFVGLFGQEGVLGISAVAFISAMSSTNPSLFLALEQEYGSENDQLAFGLVGLACVPAYPMFIYGLTSGGSINWWPIISTLIPIVLGMLVGNLDKKMAEFFKPGVVVLTPLMGWSFGSGINLLEALKAGPQGILLTVLFYLLVLVPLLIFEKGVLKDDGISAVAMSSIAGMSVSVPALIGQSNPAVAEIASTAGAQIAFGVVLTSIITPIIAQKIYKKDHA